MRPIHSMIEFKQIIGRGTRLYEGKDYFTIYDFVKAHHHFSDPEWDGEPLEPEPTRPSTPDSPPIEPPEPPMPGPEPGPRRQKIKVMLADGKARTIQHMMMTSFWHPDGAPMSAQQFLELLFGELPEFFKDETELRVLWSAPDNRAKLLQGLAEKGFGREQWPRCKGLLTPRRATFSTCWHMLLMRYRRSPARKGLQTLKIEISTHFNSKQQVFLNFVLSHYVQVGVEELDREKLRPLLLLKYHNAIADAVSDLERPEEIGKVFAGFQKYLYQEAA